MRVTSCLGEFDLAAGQFTTTGLHGGLLALSALVDTDHEVVDGGLVSGDGDVPPGGSVSRGDTPEPMIARGSNVPGTLPLRGHTFPCADFILGSCAPQTPMPPRGAHCRIWPGDSTSAARPSTPERMRWPDVSPGLSACDPIVRGQGCHRSREKPAEQRGYTHTRVPEASTIKGPSCNEPLPDPR